jgi:hypothetical protein
MMRLITFVIIFSLAWLPSQSLCQSVDGTLNNKGIDMMSLNPFTVLASLFSSKENDFSARKEALPQLEKFFTDPELIAVSRLAVNKNLSGVQAALASNKVDLNAPGYLWAMPTHFAMVWSTPEIITEFVRHGADPLLVAQEKKSVWKPYSAQ